MEWHCILRLNLFEITRVVNLSKEVYVIFKLFVFSEALGKVGGSMVFKSPNVASENRFK